MKKYVNGEYLDMTEEEIEEMKANTPDIPTSSEDPSQLDRIEEMLEIIYAKLGLG